MAAHCRENRDRGAETGLCVCLCVLLCVHVSVCMRVPGLLWVCVCAHVHVCTCACISQLLVASGTLVDLRELLCPVSVSDHIRTFCREWTETGTRVTREAFCSALTAKSE